ncbi:class I SAM-dependent methyltransferase [Aquabacterium sp. OR-4]|uniref:class I SAM-dependent methyltransferase n=1 Tax=Aquabacterium sp. OR-4 TaxID=2978127 RepID=UPI0021B345A7|nr:SAM-dependent methyltransferase [Aquabacterium sp. OR-4]MDT7835565.1 SAM-dependent methyltransferase [Aquabacterium sp. OR-4]
MTQASPAEHPARSAPPERSERTEIDRFVARLQASLDDGSFQRLALGRPQGGEPTLEKLLARRVALRGSECLSLVWRHRSKDITKNLPLTEAVELVASLIGAPFHHGHLVTRSHDIQLAMGKRGQWGLRVGRLPPAAPSTETGAAAAADPAPADAPAAAHDRQRQHALSLGEPFLAELGVTDGQQRLIPAMARKWRQINKFVEVLDHAIAQSPLAARAAGEPVRVLDFGAGRGYLTFAVQQRLVAAGRVPDIVGVELRDDLVAQCNGVAQRLGLAGLRFDAGDVRSHASGPIDIMIALHACDIATDVAMHRGVSGGAAIIVCSPCCHKELRPQLLAPAPLRPMLRHGIHMTEQAEMLTDTLRALLLQSVGYDTQVFEFVSPEHTAKNKMVLAVRRAQPLPAAQQQALRTQVAELKAFYGVRTQTLESLIDAGAAQPA